MSNGLQENKTIDEKKFSTEIRSDKKNNSLVEKFFLVHDNHCNQEEKFSNALGYFDLLPRWNRSQISSIDLSIESNEKISEIESNLIIDNVPTMITVKPACINKVFYYPSKSEEILERHIFKLATNRKNIFFDEFDGLLIKFTVKELFDSLKYSKQSRNYTQLRHSLNVLLLSSYSIRKNFQDVNLESELEFKYIKSLKILPGDNRSKTVIIEPGHAMIEAIKKTNFRQFSFSDFCRLKSELARWMYLYLVFKYPNADKNKSSYTKPFKLNELLKMHGINNDFSNPLFVHKYKSTNNKRKALGQELLSKEQFIADQLRCSARDMRSALNQLYEQGHLNEKVKLISIKDGKDIRDYVFSLCLSKEFGNKQMLSNYTNKIISKCSLDPALTD
ncbi:hypothetical protein [Photobacterium leiognathi]|uniref:hypothetical protein n=1 Tax=Photobacterium leiognathi TaxID=553611 RepID=UPI002981C378|nr:hypothetical protein [Photobacterium leiognathi]